MTNCPNCGAPITGPRCEYCGTVFEKPNYYNIAPEQFNLLNNGLRNLQAQLNEANARMANSIQTQYLLSTLERWTAEPLICGPLTGPMTITRPAPLGTIKTK